MWIGCTIRYKATELYNAYKELFNALGVTIEVVDEFDICCGYPLRIIGAINEVKRLLKNIKEILDKYEEVITPCPGCYRMLKTLTNIKVYHTSEVLLRYKDILRRLLKPLKIKITYHDPCDLGRHSEITEEPRLLIRLIPDIKFLELPLNRYRSTCCGGGGLLMIHSMELSTEVAKEKWLREIEPLEVDYVVTACPTCYKNLQYGAIKAGKEPRVLDISQLLLSSIKGIGPRKLIELWW